MIARLLEIPMCPLATDWIEGHGGTLEDMYNDCPTSSWLLYLAVELGMDIKDVIIDLAALVDQRAADRARAQVRPEIVPDGSIIASRLSYTLVFNSSASADNLANEVETNLAGRKSEALDLVRERLPYQMFKEALEEAL